MKLFAKWRRFTLGKYCLALNETRTRHTGIGYKSGCGNNILEVCHVFYVDGVEKKKHTVKYEVRFA